MKGLGPMNPGVTPWDFFFTVPESEFSTFHPHLDRKIFQKSNQIAKIAKSNGNIIWNLPSTKTSSTFFNRSCLLNMPRINSTYFGATFQGIFRNSPCSLIWIQNLTNFLNFPLKSRLPTNEFLGNFCGGIPAWRKFVFFSWLDITPVETYYSRQIGPNPFPKSVWIRKHHKHFDLLVGCCLEKVPNIFSQMLVKNGDLPWCNVKENTLKQIQEHLSQTTIQTMTFAPQ